MTGIALKRITGPGWNSKNYVGNSFGSVFDVNSAWNNSANANKWPAAVNQLTTYSGSASDPLFTAIDLSAIQDYGFGSLAISGWTPLSAIDDVLVRTFGFGSQASPGDRTVLVCLSLDSGNTCSTTELSVILPAGSAGTAPTAPATGYPNPGWTSWATTPPFAGRDFGTVITSVTTSGHIVTNLGGQSSQYFSRGWKPGGRILVNGSEIYTIAALINGSAIRTVETVVAHSTAVSFKSMCAGVRIRKLTGVGSISLAAGFDFAVSNEFNMPFTGVRNLCSQLTVNVTVDASGQPAPSRPARLCAIPTTGGHALFAFFSDNGESRLISNFQANTGYTYHGPDWQRFDGNNPSRGSYTTSDVWDPAVPTRFFTSMQLGAHYSLVRVEYTGNFAAYTPFPSTHGAYTTGFWPDDGLTYTIVGGYPSDGKGIDQQVAQLGNPYFDASQWKVWAFTGLLPGGVATWQATTPCCNENPTFFALQDVNTGTVTKLIDTIATYPMRFWGNHSTQILNGYYISIANILGSKGTTTDNYLGGPFILYPTQIQQNGAWNANTALTATYADTCPANIDPLWQKDGAIGSNCILMQAKQPCSGFASGLEAAKFPCPWDPTRSMVTPLAPGDRFWLEYPPQGSAETMRVVTPTVDLGGGIVSFWALRHSERYANLGGAYGAFSEAHPNGWTAAMIPPEARTNAASVIAPDGTVYSENNVLSATHSAIGPGLLVPNSTSIISGVDLKTGLPLPYYYGIRWNQPIVKQAGHLPDYNIYLNGRFAGTDNGGGAMENYPSMQQIQAVANEKRWFLDLHHMNPSAGTGQE
ncbi:MAG: hypothetical protein M3N54_07740, partial [Acidobacteriota bacterium]|nr:hypothetical protein [Acidobacteriota bacterium]